MKKLAVFMIAVLLAFSSVEAQEINLTKAKILISDKIASPVRETCIKVLQEEIEKRTSLRLPETDKWVSGNTTIALCLSGDKRLSGKKIPLHTGNNLAENKAEGFRLFYEEKVQILWIIGTDQRGVLFGIGKLLRSLKMNKNSALLEIPLDFASSPEYSIRGHQMGYRNTANSYDAWSVKQYEQYICELVLFGTNAIENIPLSGKGDESILMKISRKQMNIEMSNICKAYGIDYWVWIPVKVDLRNKALWNIELQKHDAYYKETPYLSNIFIPGGDPGHNHPKEMLPFIKELYQHLQKYHPGAGIWLSLQGFSEEQIDYFYKYLEDEKPTWLRGVVSGPSSPPIAETRFRLPKQYKHRHYPDITHNVRCEYPAQNFDQAFAMTIGREGSNPQPAYYAGINNYYAPFTDGFVSYSDGCHDDVNKFIWSQRGWDIDKSVNEILLEYARFFFNTEVENKVADGILALEKNWFGSLTENGSVETTFAYWENLNKKHPELAANWRWQMLMLRANYDTYIRCRLIYEKSLEKEANKILENVDGLGIENAIQKSLAKINEADTKPINQALKQKIEVYCERLFKSIGLQTSVKLYHASGSERAAILDYIDRPLNNRWWYEDEFKKIAGMTSNEDKKERLEIIRKWGNPGKGSYYDDVSNIANSPHVTSTVYDATDFAWVDNGYSRLRLSSQVYQNDPVLEYEDLNSNARYIIRISGYGDALLRIDGERMEPILYDKEIEKFKEFIVPKRLVGDGKLRLTFDQPEQSNINWRKHARVSDVWLIKR